MLSLFPALAVAIGWQFSPERFNNAGKAAVAQPVEQRIRNAWVGGSNPFRGTSKNRPLGDLAYRFTAAGVNSRVTVQRASRQNAPAALLGAARGLLRAAVPPPQQLRQLGDVGAMRRASSRESNLAAARLSAPPRNRRRRAPARPRPRETEAPGVIMNGRKLGVLANMVASASHEQLRER